MIVIYGTLAALGLIGASIAQSLGLQIAFICLAVVSFVLFTWDVIDAK